MVLVVEGVGVHGVHLVEVLVVHQGKHGEGTLRVGSLAVTVVFPVRPRADVLVQPLGVRHSVVQSESEKKNTRLLSEKKSNFALRSHRKTVSSAFPSRPLYGSPLDSDSLQMALRTQAFPLRPNLKMESWRQLIEGLRSNSE